jgi:hypothetical protein
MKCELWFIVRSAGASGRSIAAFFALCRLMVLSQPQMKKYRCLWGMSTLNHNI